MKITLIVGARPNFIKIAPIIHAIHKVQNEVKSIEYRLVHTGQHYDQKMSGDFFDQLGIPQPDTNLDSGGGTQAEQTASIMVKFEKELLAHPCDVVLVVGDVTSTMACAIVAKKLQIKVAHVEGGIRSNDWSMPEEINRLVTDAITDYFFTTSEVANNNLLKSGVSKDKIYFVGNTMIDTLLTQQLNFKQPQIWKDLNLTKGRYLVMTLHRPANVDQEHVLGVILNKIIENTEDLPLIFPVHPRTAKILENIGVFHERLHLIEPQGYLEFNYLVANSKAVITDSGGITEETTVLGIPCITLRDNTERPETVTMGTNELVGTNPHNIAPVLDRLFNGDWKKGKIPPLWDGKTSQRIVDILLSL